MVSALQLPEGFECRMNASHPIELREENETPIIAGYAAVIGRRSQNFGYGDFSVFEVIEPGAFDDVLNDDVRALINHEGIPLARTRSNTLKISSDATGLRYEFTPDMTMAAAKDLVTAMRRGDIDQSSFAFRVAKGGEWWEERDDEAIRHITKISSLRDVSIVTYPAYPDATVGLRSLQNFRRETNARNQNHREQIERRSRELDLLETDL